VPLNCADLARALQLPLPVKKNVASSAGEEEAPGLAEEVGFVENGVDSDLGLGGEGGVCGEQRGFRSWAHGGFRS
jgi:hypothetical protein